MPPNERREAAEDSPEARADQPTKAAPAKTLTDAGVVEAGRRQRMASLDRGDLMGRYVILEHLGAGGMGLVYGAYDPELDRKIALKLLHPSAHGTASATSGEQRLLREARAMAKLNHPNVISVHDLGTLDGHVFVAMEYVDGVTLGRWLEKDRSWREVLALFVRAGEGLAAAHAAELVHRDFKPDNVMIGKDGRVRVMDFGLVRATTERDRSDPDATDPDATQKGDDAAELTRAGAVIGTPAYMSPEQHLGLPTDPRTDQFSFCVALYQGLYGERPFVGESVAAVAFQVTQGNVADAPANTEVPGWVRRVVLKGLTTDPGKRYPTMEALLADLQDDPAIARRRWTTRGGITLALGGMAVALLYMREQQNQVCEGADTKLAGIWDDTRKNAVHEAMVGTELVYAEDTWVRVEQRLDAYATAWVTQHTEACEATNLRKEQSANLLDLRLACLDRRLDGVDALVDVFTEADKTTVLKAVQATSQLDPLSGCADVEALTSAVKPPEDPATRAKVVELRKQLDRARALSVAGRFKEALPIAESVVTDASGLGYTPLEAEALDRLGDQQQRAGELEKAVESLSEAAWAARSVGDDSIAANAETQLVWLLGSELGRVDDAWIWARHAEAEIRHGSRGTLIQAAWLNNVGSLLDEQGDYQAAVEYYVAAQRIREQEEGRESANVVVLLNNLGAAHHNLGDYAAAEQYYEDAVEIASSVLGAEHPNVAFGLNNLALVSRELGRPEEALERNERALAIAQRSLGSKHPWVGHVFASLGNTLQTLGRLGPAREAYDSSLRVLESSLGTSDPTYATTLGRLGALRLAEGAALESAELQREVLSVLEAAYGPEHLDLVDTLDDLAAALLVLGRSDEAAKQLDRALHIREKRLGSRHASVATSCCRLGAALAEVNPVRARAHLERGITIGQLAGAEPRVLAQAELELARLIWQVPSARTRAIALAQSARAHLTAAGRAEVDLERVDRWLEGHAL